MFLIYLLARVISPREFDPEQARHLAEHDLEPVMVCINRCDDEFIVRSHTTRRTAVKHRGKYKDIPRIFCRLREHESCEEGEDCDKPCCSPEEYGSQMAVGLATVLFDPGSTEPRSDDFVQHVLDRTRLADSVLVVGYTGKSLSMEKSEILGLERARSVARLLADGGLKVRTVAVSRPKCKYAERMRLSHRTEVIGLYIKPTKAGRGRRGKSAGGASKPKGRVGKGKDSSASVMLTEIARQELN